MADDEVQGLALAAVDATSAQSIITRRRGALGMIFGDAGGPFFSELVSGFEGEALNAHLGVLILGTHRLSNLNDLAVDLAGRVDGVGIVAGALSDELVRRIAARGVSVVLLSREPVDAFPTVHVDNFAPTLALTRHLIADHGYTSLQFLGTPDGSPDIEERWEGFLEAHRQCGLEPPAEPIHSFIGQAEGLHRTDTLIRQGELPRALVCANDQLALGALSAARIHGVRVPEDVAITGWDNIRMSDLVSPMLTTVHQPIEELGAIAARHLLAQIAGRPVAPETLLPTTNIYRGSCGCI